MQRMFSRLIAIGLLIGLCQCHWNDPPPADTIVFALSSEPKTLDPRIATDASGQRIGNLIFSSLIQRDENLEFRGDLAESWSYQNLTYSFKLKPGITFHNGDQATSQDFLYSFREFKKPRSPFAAQFNVIKNVEASYDALKGGVLKIHLKSFAAPLLGDLNRIKLLPKKIAEKTGDQFYRQPIGSGPFVFKRYGVNEILLSRNEGYFGEKALSQNIQFKVIKDSNTRFQKMYKGQIDIIQSDIPFSKVAFFKKQQDFSVVSKPGLSTAYLLLNLRHPNLKNKLVRKAISASINRDEMIRYTFEGYAEKATAIITKASPFFEDSLTQPEISPEVIKRTLAAASEKPIILKTSNTQQAIENGKIITHQLKKMGLNVEQQSYEWGTYYEDVRTGKFDMAVMKWVGVSDPDIYRISLHSEMVPPGRNRGYYNNRDFDQLAERGFKESDPTKRKLIYEKIQKMVYDDLPTIPLWYEKQVAIAHKRVKNYSLPMNGDFSALTKVYKQDARR